MLPELTELPERFTYPSPAFSSIWESPAGKLLLMFTGKPSEEEVRAYGERLMKGDDLADAVARLATTMPASKLRMMIAHALDHGIADVENAPEELVALFEQVDAVPDWVDQELLDLGSQTVRRTGNLGGYVMRDFALMGGYQSSAINKPLVFTGALDDSAANRIAETNNFWIDITRENGTGRFKPGVKTAIRVRIMHAMLRIRIQQNPEWSNEKWGLPINQADMLATNLAFSSLFVDGCRLFGFQISKKEAEAVLHLWRYAGYVLGISIDDMPTTERQARRLLYALTIAQPGADNDSKHLAQALLKEPLHAAHPKHPWLKRYKYHLHKGLNRYFLNNETNKALGISFTPWVIMGPITFGYVFILECLRKIIPGGTKLATKIGDYIQDTTRQKLLDGKTAQYKPVTHLKSKHKKSREDCRQLCF